MDDQVKTAIESLGKTFEAFKETHQQELKEIKKNGSADPITSNKLSKIESDLDKLEDVNQAVTKQKMAQDEVAERVKKVETMMSRPEFGQAYKNADSMEKKVFDKWLRQGKEALAPEELKVLTASNDNTAGYLAPPEYVQELIKGITEISPIRSIARVRSTTNRSVQIPKRTATLVKERLTNTDYQFLDIKRKMNILHILCVVTHINNTYSMSININKFLENVAKLNFVAAANGIKLQINNSNKTHLANHMSRMIKNI